MNVKLLVLAPSFPDKDEKFIGGIFVKEQVKALSKCVDEINVISPIPFSLGKEFKDRVCKDYSFNNVNVYFPRFFHLPLNHFRKRRGEREAKVIDKLIQKKDIKFDLIHAHFTWPSGYAGTKLAKRYNVPSVVTIHENRDWFLKEYHSKNEKIYWTWRNADALIRVNKKDIHCLMEFNHNVFFVPNGFSSQRLKIVEKAKARELLGLPQDKKIIFSLGALVERKGFHYLIQAISEIVEHRRDILCFIGGIGPLEDKLQKQVNNLDLQDHVKLLGFIPDEKLHLWLNAADVFVLPSLSESFGIVQLEAMAVGTPVVATYNGGSEEIIISEDYGLLCHPKNPEYLAEKILISLKRNWDREKIKRYAEQFTWDRVVEMILKVYESSRRWNCDTC